MKAYIFACNNDTMPECIIRKLFGDNKPKYVSDISPGDFCYLYNYDNKILYGIWKATSKCGCHEKDAWGGRYRFQARVELVSKTLQELPFYSVKWLLMINNQITWKLYGNKAQNLLQYFASEYAEKLLVGIKLTKLEDDYRLKYPAQYVCEDGHRVRSLSEQAIDNWLFRHKIIHAYEPVVPIPEQLIPDFMVHTEDGGCVYIEFWGMIEDPIYKDRMNKKCQVYAQKNFPLIELRQEDLKNLDFEFMKKLAKKNVAVWK
jgi:hypothetical protein